MDNEMLKELLRLSEENGRLKKENEILKSNLDKLTTEVNIREIWDTFK